MIDPSAKLNVSRQAIVLGADQANPTTVEFEEIWLGIEFSKLRRFISSRRYWADYSGCPACLHCGQTCDPGFSRWARNQAVPHSLCA